MKQINNMQGNDKKTSCSTDSLLSGLFHCVCNDKREGRMMPGSESGRSMVEMLGVLAIMGILTIGGIMGFNYAMDKQKANQIADGIVMRAMSLSPQLLLGYAITDTALDGSFPAQIGEYPVKLYGDEVGFDLVVSDIDHNVCQHVLETGIRLPSDIYLGENTLVWSAGQKKKVDFTCADTGNEIDFVFNGTLNPDEKTCPKDKPLMRARGTMACLACPAAGKMVVMIKSGCERCENTFWAGTINSTTHTVSTLNRCATCADEKAIPSTPEACARCDSSPTPRMMNGQWCVRKECPEDTFRFGMAIPSWSTASFQNCIACNEPSSYEATAEECAKCYGERKTVTVSNRTECALTTCPPVYFRGERENCLKCSDRTFEGLNSQTSMEECAKCKDTNNPRNLQGRYCRECSHLSVTASTPENCALCAGAVYRNGTCMKTACAEIANTGDSKCSPCSEMGAITTTAEECARCANREMVTTGYGYSRCALKTCDGWFSKAKACTTCSSATYTYALSNEECTRNCSAERTVSSKGYCCLKDITKYTNKNACEGCDGTWDTNNRKCS